MILNKQLRVFRFYFSDKTGDAHLDGQLQFLRVIMFIGFACVFLCFQYVLEEVFLKTHLQSLDEAEVVTGILTDVRVRRKGLDSITVQADGRQITYAGWGNKIRDANIIGQEVTVWSRAILDFYQRRMLLLELEVGGQKLLNTFKASRRNVVDESITLIGVFLLVLSCLNIRRLLIRNN